MFLLEYQRWARSSVVVMITSDLPVEEQCEVGIIRCRNPRFQDYPEFEGPAELVVSRVTRLCIDAVAPTELLSLLEPAFAQLQPDCGAISVPIAC